jgi:hypothetical protein
MNLDPTTLGIAGVLAALLITEMRLLRRELKVFLPALIERSRRRDLRRMRSESQLQLPRPMALPGRRPSQPAVPAETWDDEDTDIHALMDIERESQRARRKTGRRSAVGDRPPRPGTHHD